MIQLTKGTNVLDINLSDFSGAGQDVVQNGSFNDIGSDLVQNGDFAEIGSELVTNGDFSAAGSNLVTNPNFTDTGIELVTNGDFATDSDWTKIGGATISGGQANIDGDGTSFVSISQASIFTEGKSYKVTADVTITSGLGLKFQDGANNENIGFATTSGSYTFYFVATSNATFVIGRRTGGTAFESSVDNVSVKELGEDWTQIVSDPDSISFVENGVKIVQGSDVGLDNRVFQGSVTEDDKSYKVTYTIHSISLTSGNSVKYYNGTAYVVLPEQGVGTHTFYYTRQGTDGSWYFNLATPVTSATDFVTISSIVVQELGEDWVSVDDTNTFGENGLTMTSTEAADVKIRTNEILADNTSYKVTYTIHAVGLTGTNAIQYYTGSALNAYDDLPEQGVGTHTFYYTTPASTNQNWFFRLDLRSSTSTTDFVTISSISVKEVGQDWTVQEGWTVEDDKASYDAITYARYITQFLTLSLDKFYKIQFTISTGTARLKFTNESDAELFTNIGKANYAPDSYTLYGRAIASTELRIYGYNNSGGEACSITNISVEQLDTNDRWVTFADPDSKSVMKLGQVDLEIDSSGNNCGVYQTGLIKPNKLYIITINMKATAAIYVEIAASLGTAVSAVIGTELLTTSYKEYSFEYVTPFAVDHDLQIHRLFGSGANQTISIDYVSMNGVDESQWTNDPTWDPFATSLVFVPTLTDESTNNSKQFTLDTSISDGGWDGRSLHGQVIINEFPTEVPASGIINLKQPDFLEGFYQVEIRGYLGTFYRVLGKCMAHLERTSTEDGYNRFESYNDTVTYKAYEE